MVDSIYDVWKFVTICVGIVASLYRPDLIGVLTSPAAKQEQRGHTVMSKCTTNPARLEVGLSAEGKTHELWRLTVALFSRSIWEHKTFLTFYFLGWKMTLVLGVMLLSTVDCSKDEVSFKWEMNYINTVPAVMIKLCDWKQQRKATLWAVSL